MQKKKERGVDDAKDDERDVSDVEKGSTAYRAAKARKTKAAELEKAKVQLLREEQKKQIAKDIEALL